MLASERHLLLFVEAPLRRVEDQLLFESQACHGLERWLDSFDRITLAAPLLPSGLDRQEKPANYEPVADLPFRSRLEVQPLPWAFGFREFLRQRARMSPRLKELLHSHRYLHFVFSGWAGCWGRAAALEALRAQLPYSVHLERVESSVAWVTATTAKSKAKFVLDSVPRVLSDRRLLPNAEVVLAQGADTVSVYGHYNANTIEIVNVHTKEASLPSVEQINTKALRATEPGPLQIVYAGRIAREKAPLDWIRALHHARKQGAEFVARWYGAGAMESEARASVDRLDLAGCVEFMGHIADRNVVLSALQEAHVLQFTHVSREPSRILVEALNMGTPIVGYESLRAKALVAKNGGGLFSPPRDPRALGALLVDLASDRSKLAKLILNAATDGRSLTSEAAFRYRSKLIIDAIDGASTRPGRP